MIELKEIARRKLEEDDAVENLAEGGEDEQSVRRIGIGHL